MLLPTPLGSREVKLTFDDGPNPLTTPTLLDELKKAGIKATFFMLGQNLESAKGKEILQRVFDEGHNVGNHSYSHPDLTKLTVPQVEEEIGKTEQLIGAHDRGIKLLRPPYGAHDAAVDEIVKKHGYRLALWNVDTLDWSKTYKEGGWVDHAMQQIEHGKHCIVLNHDIHLTTVSNLPRLIAAIQALPDTHFAQLS